MPAMRRSHEPDPVRPAAGAEPHELRGSVRSGLPGRVRSEVGLTSDAFRAFIESAADGIVVVERLSRRIVDLNEAVVTWGGAERHVLLRSRIDHLVPAWSDERAWERFLHTHLPHRSPGGHRPAAPVGIQDPADPAPADPADAHPDRAGERLIHHASEGRVEAFTRDAHGAHHRFSRLVVEHDGEARPHHFDVIPRSLQVDGMELVVLTVRNVSPEVRAEAERMQMGKDLMRIIQMLPDVVFSCEKRADGKIYWTLNEGRLAAEFGVTTKAIEGKSLEELFPGGASDEMKAHFEAAFRGETTEFVNEIHGRFFKHFPQPVFGPDREVRHVVGFISEVTGLVAAEQRIQKLNDEMQRRVDELATANRELEAFSYTVSHDLRSPLAVIDAVAQVVLETEDGLSPTGQERLGRVRQAVEKTNQMVEDILRLSRAARQPLEPEPVDLAAIARDVAGDLATRHPGRAVRFEVDDHLPTHADPGLVRIVLDNLLKNAWKYTAEREDAVVRFGVEHDHTDGGLDGAGPLYVVEDNGAGFPPEEAQSLFEAFHRAHDDMRFQGIGIGLATVRRIIQRHGGTIWAEGEEGRGARFRFTLGALTSSDAVTDGQDAHGDAADTRHPTGDRS